MKRFLSLLVLFASAASGFAQAAPPDQPILPRTTNILEAMFAAGPVIILLLILSIISVTMIVVYLLTIRRGAIVTSGYMATADALLRKRDYLGLLAVSNRHGEAIARVVQKTLDFMTKNPTAGFAQAREIAETEGTRVATKLHNRVAYLADIATIGPLVGLFGTVLGIIHSFGALGSDLGPTRYTLLSKGISEALINTCGGLGIGITAMIFYAFFRGRAQALISDLESASTHIIALLSLQHTPRRSERAAVLLEDEF